MFNLETTEQKTNDDKQESVLKSKLKAELNEIWNRKKC